MKNFDEFYEDMSSAITAVYQKHNIYSKIEDFFNEEDLYRVIRIMKNRGFFDTEDLYESKNISEDTFRKVFNESNNSCWEDFYKDLMRCAKTDDDPDSMIDAIERIDNIHEKCGAFKNMDKFDKEELCKACNVLAGASSYSLYTKFEDMCEYFGFNEGEE